MSRQPNPAPKVLFGPFEFEHLSGDLRKFGNRIRLQGKPLQILSILLEQPGQVLSREELQQHLWQGTTFVDFEQGLNTAVNKLRQALGDSADQPRYIETVPGKGYRFIAPLQGASPVMITAVLEMAAPSAPRIEPKPRERRSPWALLVAVAPLILLAGGFWLAATRREPAAMAKPASFAPRSVSAGRGRTMLRKHWPQTNSRFRPTGLLMDASSLLGTPQWPGLQAKSRATCCCSTWPTAVVETTMRTGILGRSQYDVTPDGKRFLIIGQPAAVAASATPITIVQNWTALLKK